MQPLLKLLVSSIDERSPSGVAGGVSRLIRDGSLGPGTRLPTVREFAAALGTSPTTISQAWALLAWAGLISPQGRRGTFVADEQSPRGVWRVRRTMGSPGRPAMDLSTGTPDLDLLPDVARAIARMVPGDNTRQLLRRPRAARARGHVARTLALRAAHDDGGRRSHGCARPHRARADPAGESGADRKPRLIPRCWTCWSWSEPQLIALDLDDNGVIPDSLRAGLARQPDAVFLQPRAQNPTGVSLSRERAAELAELLSGTRLLIVEDDHCGDIAQHPVVSLGAWLPESTVHIQSFSKSYGPDLRLAAMSGPTEIMSSLVDRRLLGPGWSSRLLQQVLLELLRDPATQATVARARETYTHRRHALVDALAEHGVQANAGDGINAWIRVRDEQTTLLAMATNGVGVAAGSPFTVSPLASHHVRVTAGLIRGDQQRVAGLLAASMAAKVAIR